MIKITIGFVLGVFATFYSLPWVERTSTDLPRPNLSELVSSKDSKHTSNIINSMSLDEIKELQDTDLAREVMSMAYNLKNKDWTEPASGKLINMVKNIATREPQIGQHIQAELSNGMTNIEAFAIINTYFSKHEG